MHLTAAVRTGDLLDLVLAALAIAAGVRGYRQGLLVGAASLIGFIGGALIGTRIAGPIAALVSSGSARSFVALLIVLAVAILLQELLAHVAAIGRDALKLSPLRVFDSVFGTVLSVAAMLFVAWLLGLAVINSPFTGLARQVRHSRVLTAVDDLVPNGAYLAFSSFLRAVEIHGLPPVFAGLNPPLAPPVAAPVNGAVPSRVIRAAAPSIVKIAAVDPRCGQQTEGSGFVYAPGRVLTNAHVVAGARSVTIVSDGTGTSLGLRARVVLFDPNTDVAVLDVPGLARASLAFHGPVATGASAEVIGYPENGPFTATAARVAARQLITGPNIYSDATVTRQIYVLRATVRPGNSGGPLLAPNGKVNGVVFATSTTDPSTGYALTAHQVSADARAGASATRRVGTQNCA
jgi:S1-C subfamily serine protease